MKLKTIADFYRCVLGINQRNLHYVYPANPRKYFPIANDKALTKKFLSQQNIPVPQTYCLISTMGEINTSWPQISARDEFVIKPAKGKAGGGILIIKKEDSAQRDSSGNLFVDMGLKKHMADIIFGVYSFGLWDKVMIEYYVHSHFIFKNIFPQGVADIRVLVYNHIPKTAMVRMPTYKSRGRANLHKDAIGISVDLENGVMGDGYDFKGYLTKHPDTAVEFKGVQIPFWNDILQICKKTSEAVPLNYIGVDIVIDENKGPLVMEINARPGLEIQNVNRQGLRQIL